MFPERRPARVHASLWALLAAIAALLPFLAGFSTTRVFFIRDLGMYFWPRHLWLRQAWQSGESLLWDPYAAAGQSAVADALNQFFLLPVTALRLLAPDVVGFNLWVAAPFPVMAVGMWLWLRLRCSPQASFVGATIFSVAGPVVSSGNFPNFSWAVAFIPWILWCAEQTVSVDRGRWWFAALAGGVAAQAVAGEPVTLAVTSMLVVVYSATATPASRLRTRVDRALHVSAAVGVGALLAAVQLIPLAWAARHSVRGDEINTTFWSLHPLAAVEMFVAHVFGHAHQGTLERFPWMTVLNSGREPLLYSLYIGIVGCVLALMAARDRDIRRWRAFWWTIGGVSLLCAFGNYTPVYPAFEKVLPILGSFRFPIKYMIFGVLSLAALAASGADALLGHRRAGTLARPTVGLSVIGGLTVLSALLAVASVWRPDLVLTMWEAVARLTGVERTRDGAEWLLSPAATASARVAGLGVIASFLVALVWFRHRLSPIAIALLCGAAVVDPIVVNADLNPVMPAAQLGPPAWLEAMRAHRDDRVYVGGRVRRSTTDPNKRLQWRIDSQLIDAPNEVPVSADTSLVEAVTTMSAQFAYAPAAWRMRETISYDLPQLLPVEYDLMVRRFRSASREARMRFVGRTGVRYCFLDAPPFPGARTVVGPDALTPSMALYECQADPRRVYVTEAAMVEPNVERQLDLMFAEDHNPFEVAVIDRHAPARAGRLGPASTAGAEIVAETNTELVVSASAGAGGGYLTVLDSFSPLWRVTVDEAPAVLLRANGLYRAVRLAPGTHEVRFRYRPTPFYLGLGITSITLVALLAGCGWELRRPRRSARTPQLTAV